MVNVELGTPWEMVKGSERDAGLFLPGMAPDSHGRLKKNRWPCRASVSSSVRSGREVTERVTVTLPGSSVYLMQKWVLSYL
jgi:hypothetical protein